MKMKMALASLSGCLRRQSAHHGSDAARKLSSQWWKAPGRIGFVKGDGLLKLSAVDGGTEVAYEGDAQVGGTMAAVGQRLIRRHRQNDDQELFREASSRGRELTSEKGTDYSVPSGKFLDFTCILAVDRAVLSPFSNACFLRLTSSAPSSCRPLRRTCRWSRSPWSRRTADRNPASASAAFTCSSVMPFLIMSWMRSRMMVTMSRYSTTSASSHRRPWPGITYVPPSCLSAGTVMSRMWFSASMLALMLPPRARSMIG